MPSSLTLSKPAEPKGKRRTVPLYANGYATAGIIPRRGFAPAACRVLEAAESQGGVSMATAWGGTALLYLLRIMVESHPIASYAMGNDLDFAFGPEVRIVAVEKKGQKEDHPEGTAAIEALWSRLPREVGGLRGLLEIAGSQLSLTGMTCLEAVPGGVGVGVISAVDVEPLSLAARSPEGKQIGASWQQLRASSKTESALDPTTVFVGGWRGSVDNPYGIPRYGGAFRDLVCDFGEQQALADVMRAVAWPHLVFQFAFATIMAAAEKDSALLAGRLDADGKQLTPYTFAKQEFNKFNAMLPTLLADDSVLVPERTNGGQPVDVVSAGQGLGSALDATVRRALRVAQGMGHPPSMVNLSLGGTQAYFEEDFKRHCRKLENFRAAALEAVCWLAQLHLRLLGMNLLVEVRKAPIYTEDALKAAKARAQEIDNELTLAFSGVIKPDEASQNLTQTPIANTTFFEDARQRWLKKGSAKDPSGDSASGDSGGQDNTGDDNGN